MPTPSLRPHPPRPSPHVGARAFWTDARAEGSAALLAAAHAAAGVVGATLWSTITASQRADVERCVGDYRRIRNWTVDDCNRNHLADARAIAAAIGVARAHDKRVVVVSHHPPFADGSSHPKYAGDRLSSAFAADLDPATFFTRPVAAWCYGHTHHSTSTVLGDGVRLLSNQRGGAREHTGFVDTFTFDV